MTKETGTRAAALSFAFVWFTTHFGGGFSSGRQLVDFYVSYGWYAIFTPFIALTIMAFVYYFAWKGSVVHRAFDYHSWGKKFYGRYSVVFGTANSIMYNLILLTATSVAFATGGSVLKELFGSPYVLNTIIIAVLILLLTIFGAEVVRRAATVMAVLIIGGMVAVYATNLVVNFPLLKQVILQAPSPKGAGGAVWKAITYAGFQVCLIGAFVSVADVLKTKQDVFRASLYGFIVNAVILWLATAGALTHYPAINNEVVPIIYIARHSVGEGAAGGIVSGLILLAVISTGVSCVYGGAKRIVVALQERLGDKATAKGARATHIMSSLVYVAVTWAIALFGLLPLISKGYGTLGVLAIPLIIIPVLVKGFSETEPKAIPATEVVAK